MRSALPLALVASLAIALPARAADWLQFGYDTPHSGFNREERGYPTPAGNTVLFHYALPAVAGTNNPGTIDGAPVYLAGVVTAAGTRNLLFGLRNDGTLLALDADSTTLDIVWSRAPSGAGATTRGFGSPALDPDRQYVYAYGFDGKIHKYHVGDGSEITGGGWPETATLKPDVEKGAGGLSIATANDAATYLYSVTDGYIGDGGDYQGHLTTINLASGAQTVFNSACSTLTIHFVENGIKSGSGQNDCAAAQNGIWGRPGAVYDSATHRVFIMTGNGPYNASSGGSNWGDSLLALNPDGSGDGTGEPLDSYTPTTFQNLQNADADFGSSSIAILPPPPGTAAAYAHIAMAGGKDGCVRLVNLSNLSGSGAPGHVGGELQQFNFAGGGDCAGGANSSDIKPQPAVWVDPQDQTTLIYIATYSNGLAAYKVALDGAGKPSLVKRWPASGTAAKGSSPVVANGVVYYASSGKLRALDARSGTALVTGGDWFSTTFSGPHWQSPLLVNGRLYLFDNANPSNLWVYALDGAFRSGFE